MLNYIALKRTKIAFTLSLLIMLQGCQDEVISTRSGNIVGFVSLVDEDGRAVQNASGVKVTLDEKHSATTNSEGRFEFENVEAGTYHVLYEKEGFGIWKKFNYLFAAGNVPGLLDNVTMAEQPAIKLIDKSVEISNGRVRIKGAIEETEKFYLVFTLSKKADGTNSISSYLSSYCCLPTTEFSADLYLPAESPLYLKISAVNYSFVNNATAYLDFERSVYVYSGEKELVAPFKIN